jgi:hypothetical protein
MEAAIHHCITGHLIYEISLSSRWKDRQLVNRILARRRSMEGQPAPKLELERPTQMAVRLPARNAEVET